MAAVSKSEVNSAVKNYKSCGSSAPKISLLNAFQRNLNTWASEIRCNATEIKSAKEVASELDTLKEDLNDDIANINTALKNLKKAFGNISCKFPVKDSSNKPADL